MMAASSSTCRVVPVAAREWSPLRPKSISTALAAAAGEPVATMVQTTSRRLENALPGQPEAVRSEGSVWPPRVRPPAFELPENVSKRPTALMQPDVGARGGGDAATSSGLAGRKRNALEATLGKRGGAGTSGAKRSRWAASGPARAAARRRQQQVAKRLVSRRLALWRSRVIDGERQVVYVSLAGELMQKSGRAFRAATSDQRYLRRQGILSNGPRDSAIVHPEEVEPFKSRRGDDPLALSYWCVPECVEVSYRDAGVRRLHRWQADCLAGSGVLDGRPLVYVAPTSAGKSLVAEILMLRQLLFTGRRSLLILPYVSICVERVEQLRRFWGGCGVRVEALYSASDGYWHSGADIAVCTIEKASTLLNRLLDDNVLLRDVGMIVVDEMHLLGEEHRGYILELILIKARLSALSVSSHAAGSTHDNSAAGAPYGSLQVIGMSATLPNVDVLANWLGAHLFVCNERPVPLDFSIASGGRRALTHENSDGSSGAASEAMVGAAAKDPEGVGPLAWETVSAGGALLVFCATKEWCERAAVMLAHAFADARSATAAAVDAPDEARLRVMEELRQTPSGLCPLLAKSLPQGVAYHHAGLTLEERSILESAYRAGIVGCLCATSTLAAGVNLPARRVIIRSLKVGSGALDAVRFRQMAGRAGRTGFCDKGECVVMAKTGQDITSARKLFDAELAPLHSSLHGQRLARAVLEVISLGLVRTRSALEGRFAHSLLRYHEVEMTAAEEARAVLLGDLHVALSQLEEQQLVRVDPLLSQRPNGESDGAGTNAGVDTTPDAALMATPLGDGVVHSALRPAEALAVFEDLQRARTGLRLDGDLHLLFLATPIIVEIEPDWQCYLGQFERLPSRDRAVAEAVGIDPAFLLQQSQGRRGPVAGGFPTDGASDWRQRRERVEAVHRRFWSTLALQRLVAEVPAAQVASMFGVPRGRLQSLQASAAAYCGMVRSLCERLRWYEFAALFESLSPRLCFGVAPEALPLAQIPGVHAARARALLQAGLDSVEAVSRASPAIVERALRRLHQFESCSRDVAAARAQETVVRAAALQIVRGAQERLGRQLQELEDEADDESERLRSAAASALAPRSAA